MVRKVIWALAALWLIGMLMTLAVSAVVGGDETDDGDLSMPELGTQLASTMQSDLRDMQRKRGLHGRITVVRVDCKNEKYPRFTCLAQVAAIGEVRTLRPKNTTITGRLGGHGGWDVKTTWLD